MESYPNIFDYATKEFTQDAIICWLLSCEKTCISFLNKFIFKEKPIEKVTFEYGPSKQVSYIDVYVNIEIDGKYYSLIFENKANTTLHDDQLQKYCDTVLEWYKKKDCLGKIYYIYFKTGYLSNKEKNYLQNEYCRSIENKDKFYKEPVFITAEDMQKFISDYNDIDILNEYNQYLKKLIKTQKENLNNWYKPESLNNHIGQGRFWENIYGDDTVYNTANSGSIEYSYKNLITYKDKNENILFWLLFRFEPRWVREGKGNDEYRAQPYIQFQLYRHNKHYDKNNKWYSTVQDYCKKITGEEFPEYGKGRNPKADYNGAEIFRITFTPEKNGKFFTDYFRELSRLITDKLSEKEVIEKLFENPDAIKPECYNQESETYEISDSIIE